MGIKMLQSSDHPCKIKNDGIIYQLAEAVNKMVPDQHGTYASTPWSSSDKSYWNLKSVRSCAALSSEPS